MNRSLPLSVALVALVSVLAACSGRLDQQEATDAAIKAADLFKTEFAAKAPRLQATDLHKTLGKRIESIDSRQQEPRLLPDYLSAQSPRFVDTAAPQGTTENFQAIAALCKELPRHDIPLDLYPCQELTDKADTVAKSLQELRAGVTDARLSEEHISRLQTHLMTLEGETIRHEDGSVRDETLVAIVFGNEKFQTPLPHIEQDLRDLKIAANQVAGAMADLEVLSHQLIMQFAWDMRAKHAGPQWEHMEKHRVWLKELADREMSRTRDKVSSDRLRMTVSEDWPQSASVARHRALQEVMARMGQEPVKDVIAGILPGGGQYMKLLAARERYIELSDKGGFTKVDGARLRKLKTGKRSPAIVTLRQRLEQEGYKTGDANSDLYDEDLKAALRTFQRTHQVKDKGQLDKATVAALNITAKEKLTRVRLAMRKWRESMPREEDHVYVNIPDFYGEFWVNGKRDLRFRVVVGDTKRKIRRGEGRVMVNATPTTFALIDRVVYNPFWNVPKRIFKREILRNKTDDMDDDERKGYLESKGFQVMGHGTKGEWVRQPPGPGNALGQVKIIFPNPHEIYMHDTQSKNLFYRPVRAFSHGCVRLHEPLVLARRLLEYDNQYDHGRISRVLRKYDNTKIFLQNKIPIIIDYITVRVADDGRVHFLHDVYRRDEERLRQLASR